jgi:gas vesicle protein
MTQEFQMKSLIFLLTGFIAGAVLALFFAPESGEVLRTQLGGEATAERQKLDAQVHAALTKLQDHVDAMHADLTGYIHATQPDEDAAS